MVPGISRVSISNGRASDANCVPIPQKVSAMAKHMFLKLLAFTHEAFGAAQLIIERVVLTSLQHNKAVHTGSLSPFLHFQQLAHAQAYIACPKVLIHQIMRSVPMQFVWSDLSWSCLPDFPQLIYPLDWISLCGAKT
jgi:hypothetical protein